PLLEALHLQRNVEFFQAFCFYNEEFAGRFLYDEIGKVVGNLSLGVYVVDLELNCQVVFDVRNNVRTIFQERREFQLQRAVADDAVENALLRNDVGLFLRDEGAGLAQVYRVAYQSVSTVLNGESVNGGLESI